MTLEKLLWPSLAALIVVIFVFSGEGFYRYPCQDPKNWTALECTPPLCTRTKMCADDLTGGPQNAQN